MNKLSASEREALLLQLLRQLLAAEISEGQLLRTLRRDVLGLSQERYAALAGISRRTLSDLERDKASPSIVLLNAAFRPLGLQVGLLPRSSVLLSRLIAE